jgi:predicted membrane channel-forming protein YqfA (hemolysin III family)
MSKSKLETSQVDTDHSSTSEDSLDFFPHNSPPQTEPKQANALSILYAAAMAVISALLLRKHSRKWKQWSAIVGILFYSLGKIAMRGGAQK